jgi:lipopolysaccharide transport system ATP-binding protein
MSAPVIEACDLGKLFHLGTTRRVRAHEMIARALHGLAGQRQEPRDTPFWALRDCSFTIQRGEVAAILGHNGAGKSVLLKILSHIIRPTEGRAVLRGRVVSLLGLGTGFDPEMTGRENIFLNGSILGVQREQLEKRLDRIVSFSGIESFIDEPVKHYSSGMHARLAFAIAAHVDADVMLVDEVLAVGDAAFSEQCIAHIQAAVQQGVSVLFVSHSMDLLQRLCSRGIVINGGRLVFDGNATEAVNYYGNASRGHLGDRSLDLVS